VEPEEALVCVPEELPVCVPDELGAVEEPPEEV